MSQETIKLAFIGCGGIARRHVRAMKDLVDRDRTGFTVTAVCDANVDAAQDLAELLNELLGMTPRIYNDYQAMLTQEDLDGADLCLPHGLHHTFTVACMEAGVHVLTEKPIGVTVKAGQVMADAAERTGKTLSIAVPHRRQPGQRAVHWVLNESKLIGNPLTFFHNYTRPPENQPANQPVPQRVLWRRDRMMSGGGMTLDSGFHYCDSIRYFFGDVDKVYAEMRELKSGQPMSVLERPEDSIYVTFSFKSGVVGTWAWSIAAPGEPIINVAFYGSEGSLHDTTDSLYRIFHLFEWSPNRREDGYLVRQDGTRYTLAEIEQMYLASLSPEQAESIFPGGSEDGFAIEIWEFVELLQGKRTRPEVDATEGIKSLALGEAIYESAFTGEAIKVDDVLSGKLDSYQAPINAHWNL
ncbi:MAG: Gfo/Idh/MocA family oxidoreductase [Caldilineaceae bacterium]|nr:Gfo/Idh/MocA family oxidoreductase [Caldilineaceae bacterium]